MSTANTRAETLIALTERLSARLIAETKHLEAHRPQDLAASVDETRSLSGLYRQETLKLKHDPSPLSGLSEPLKARLKTATEDFMQVSARHARAVEAAKTVSEGLLRALAEEMGNDAKSGLTYGPKAVSQVPSSQSLTSGYKA